MKKLLQWIVLILIGIILLELILQVLSRGVNPYGSYPEFFEVAIKKIKKSNAKDYVFFVGDSTIYGGGATDPPTRSLAPNFQKLLKKRGSKLKVLNLGYPGTTGKQHLEILRLLPEKSRVFLRTGINDSWNRYDSYRVYLFGKYFEIRTIKLLVIAYHGWKRSDQSNEVTRDYYEELLKVASERQLDIHFVDYFLGSVTFMKEFFGAQENFVPLAKLLKDAGYFDGEFISKRYLHFDLVHANDPGYKLQALALFHYCCEKKYLGLKPEDRFPLHLEEEDEKELLERYELVMKQLQSSEDRRDYFLPAMDAAWQLYAFKNQKQYLEVYRDLVRIMLLAYHDIYPATVILNRVYMIRNGSHAKGAGDAFETEELRFYLDSVQLFAGEGDEIWIENYKKWFPDLFVSKEFSDYSSLPKPFNLEFCEKAMLEMGFSGKNTGLDRAWKRIFHEGLAKPGEIPVVCEVQ